MAFTLLCNYLTNSFAILLIGLTTQIDSKHHVILLSIAITN